jgi:Rha family phage regulatory protein
MNMPTNPGDFNSLVNEKLRTNSRIIAEVFEKRHDNVLRDIRSLIESNPDWGALNFEDTPYVDRQNGQTYQMYEMTRDGYSMLVMGFTGKKAMDWKIKFLAAFNAMEAQIRLASQPAPIDLHDPSQLVPLLNSYAIRTQAAEAKVVEMAPKAEAYDRLDTAVGNLTPRPASKVLGYPEAKLTKWLEVNRWAFRQNGKGPLQAYTEKRNSGYLDHKLNTYRDQQTGEDKVSITLVITPKGLAKLATLLPRDA